MTDCKNIRSNLYTGKIFIDLCFFCFPARLTLMNHSSSSRIPLQNTLFVVNRGNWSVKGCKKTLRDVAEEVGSSCHLQMGMTTFILYFNVMPVYTCKSITVVSRLKGADDLFLGRLFHIISCSPSVFSTFNTQIQCHTSCKLYLSGCI